MHCTSLKRQYEAAIRTEAIEFQSFVKYSPEDDTANDMGTEDANAMPCITI